MNILLHNPRHCSLVGVQPRPWARTTLDLELLQPPSSLSLSLLTQGGLRPVLERPIGCRITRGSGGWWGGAPGAVSTPNLLLDDAPPGAAASSSTVKQHPAASTVTSKHSHPYCIIRTSFPHAFRSVPKRRFLDMSLFIFILQTQMNTDFLSLIRRERSETFEDGNPQSICLVCARRA